jgi:glycerate kinase
LAEAALRRLAMVWSKQNGSASKLPGSGAAGGLGFGMHCFAGAKIESGFELFSRMSKLPQLIRRHDLVITGEGTLDRQTVMGKGVGELAKMARNCDCDCFGLAGKIEDEKMLSPYFNECAALVDLTSSRKAEANAAIWLERSAGNLAKQCAI